jgi:cytochrome c oxidase subunit 2
MPTRFSPVFDPASPQAGAISSLFALVLVICGVILLIVAGMVCTALIRYRHRPNSPDPPAYFGNRKLEIIWTVVPMLVIFWLFVLTVRGMQESDPPASQDSDLVVIGHQWWWEVRYAQAGVVSANEIHIPVGRNWRVRLESTDVIHNFWVPQLARKIQMIPGQPNYIWLEADSSGIYDGSCAEYCGAEHAWMRFTVIAESPAAYAAWLSKQEKPAVVPTTDSARAGLKIFQTMTCINCHSIRGVSMAGNAAPDLTHLASRATLGAGVLSNTEANLFLWLKNPQAAKPGCLMPDLKLTDAQAHALVSYLETLQ